MSQKILRKQLKTLKNNINLNLKVSERGKRIQVKLETKEVNILEMNTKAEEIYEDAYIED